MQYSFVELANTCSADQQNSSKYVLGFLPSRQKSESHNNSCKEFKEQHVTEIGIP